MSIRLFALVTLAFLLFANVDAESIKLSPLKSYLVIDGSRENCTTVHVFPDINTNIEDRWSLIRSSNSNDYNLSANNIGISFYSQKTSYGVYRLCFRATRNGNFYGVIFFRSGEDVTKMGSLIEISSVNQNTLEKISLFTSNAIRDIDGTNVGLGVVFTLMLIIVIILVLKTLGFFRHKDY